MKVTQLYTYPIKSLRGVPVRSVPLTPNGFPYDRRLMLLKVHPDASCGTLRLENMLVGKITEMALFGQQIREDEGVVVVIYNDSAAGMEREGSGAKEKEALEVPLEPDIEGLEEVDVVLHLSPTKAYRMREIYNEWFSDCFGYEVILAYLGPHLRPVLGNVAPRNKPATNSSPISIVQSSWLSRVSISALNIGLWPQMNRKGSEHSKSERPPGITFADVAPYLIVTEESLNDVSSRLEDRMNMDITKFRPNIVLSGSEKPYDEDFWAALKIYPTDKKNDNNDNFKDDSNDNEIIDLVLTQNCGRCQSINIDYNTGKATGTVLKKLMRDRRVDRGNKYSPIFGRYGFLQSSRTKKMMISVGDEVIVSKRNQERTAFEWPGLT